MTVNQQVNCWMCGIRCHSNPDSYQKGLCRPCYVSTKEFMQGPKVRMAKCKVCGAEWQHTGPGLSPTYCMQHTNNRAAKKRLKVLLPAGGIGTCAWCGDWFAKKHERSQCCSTKCGSRISFRVQQKFRLEYRACVVCGDEFQTAIKRRKYCDKAICKGRNRPWTPEGWKVGKPSTDRYLARRRAAVEVGDRDLTTLTIYLKAGGVCAACGIDTMHPQTPRAQRPKERYNWATLDHIKPLIQGGSHTWDNAQLLCLSCNSRKAHTDRKALQSVPA